MRGVDSFESRQSTLIGLAEEIAACSRSLAELAQQISIVRDRLSAGVAVGEYDRDDVAPTTD
jgi:hypothetical protein